MTDLEKAQLSLMRKFLRLSSERDLYTIEQAAFRLNVSRNEFKGTFVDTGTIRLKLVGSRLFVPKCEINFAIDQMQSIVHKKAI